MSKISKKEMEEVRKNRKESVNALAEKYLSENPITEPLEDYFKKVFVDAYTLGENILDVVYEKLTTSQVAIRKNNIQIAGQKIQKRTIYKGWGIYWNKEEQMYNLYTPDEMEKPAGYRDVEMQLGDIYTAKLWIDKY